MLTGKAKKLFEEWLSSDFEPNENEISATGELEDIEIYASNYFEILPLSMQWGVIEDWADSEGYIMNIFENDGGGKWGIYITTVSLCRSTSYGYKWNTRPEARKAAIEKLNELINN